ncbi:hypothetical protein SeLEV6574_g00946 [Synchytrium endobioticum]|uniref:Mitochondrial genome maintenance protein MGM101 n=1 Tax=Synchytrium endobioticum TaxID=286115 RepID=A0A507DFP0_9FUNG|nr:hypothetical protein SeLEV6574_g00946 [Synchytrium endobioticum]
MFGRLATLRRGPCVLRHGRFYATAPAPPSTSSTVAKTSPRSTKTPPSFFNGPRDMHAFPSANAFENESPRDIRAYTNDSTASIDKNGSSSSDSQQNEAFHGDGGMIGPEDLTKSFKGISAEPFPEKVSEILMAPIKSEDVELKPDGLLYLPEIKYRRILNKAFGPGGWGIVPRGPHTISQKTISREYALFCLGRFVSQARGEQDFFGDDNIATASEGCKSNALMRCCKDLGIASELWDPVYIKDFKKQYAAFVQGTHVTTSVKRWVWRRKDRTLDYPFKEEVPSGSLKK